MVLLTVSLAAAILHRRAIVWVVLGGVALSAFLVTGTRSNLLMFVTFPVLVVLAGRALALRSIAASVGVCLVAVVLALTIQAGFERAADEGLLAVPSPTPTLTAGSTGPSGGPAGSPGAADREHQVRWPRRDPRRTPTPR